MDRSNFWKLEGINGNHDGTVICSIARDNRVSSIWNTGPIVAETLTDESEHDVFAEKIGAIDPFVKFFSLNYRYRTNKSWTKKIPCSLALFERELFRRIIVSIRIIYARSKLKRMDMFLGYRLIIMEH